MLLINQSGCGGKRCSYQEIGKLSNSACSCGEKTKQVFYKLYQDSSDRTKSKCTNQCREI